MYLVVNGFGASGSKIRRTRVEPPLNESDKVSDLRSRVASIINKSPDSFLLMHCGVVLRDDDQPLSSHNIRPTTASVHVFPKPPATSNEARSADNLAPKMSDDEMQQFMIAFGMAVIIIFIVLNSIILLSELVRLIICDKTFKFAIRNLDLE